MEPVTLTIKDMTDALILAWKENRLAVQHREEMDYRYFYEDANYRCAIGVCLPAEMKAVLDEKHLQCTNVMGLAQRELLNFDSDKASGFAIVLQQTHDWYLNSSMSPGFVSEVLDKLGIDLPAGIVVSPYVDNREM